MRTQSYRYVPGGGIELISIDVGPPAPGELQIRASVCGICAWDVNTYRTGPTAKWSAPPGHEAIGRVVAIGSGVEGYAVGDRVTGLGAQGLQNVPADRAYKLPESDLDDSLWMVEPVSCVVTGVDHANVKIGDRLAVVGCGFMGLLLVQCLAHSFADSLLAADVQPARLALASAFGADATLNPAADGAQEVIAAAFASGIDTVVDASGSAQGLALTQRLVRRGGHINNFGWIHGPVTITGDDWHMMGWTVVNSSPTARIRDTWPVAVRLIDRGTVRLEKLVTHVVPLAGLAELLDGVTRREIPSYIKGVIRLD